MSVSKHVTLWCDFDECMAWTDHGEREVGTTRRLARAVGWTHRQGGDYCCTEHAEGRHTSHEVLQAAYDARQRERLVISSPTRNA